MFQTHGLSHIQLTVRDVERSARFYKGLLGMEEIRRFDDCVMLRTPGSHEVFTINARAEASTSAGEMGGIAHFGFRLREPLEMTTVLEEAARLGGKPGDHGGRREKGRLYAYVTDPDGYEVELFWEEN